jgi:hypothetical protein
MIQVVGFSKRETVSEMRSNVKSWVKEMKENGKL